MDTGRELTPIPGAPKRPSGPPVRAGACGGQGVPGTSAFWCVPSHGTLCRPAGLATLCLGATWGLAVAPLQPLYSLARTTGASSQEEASLPQPDDDSPPSRPLPCLPGVLAASPHPVASPPNMAHFPSPHFAFAHAVPCAWHSFLASFSGIVWCLFLAQIYYVPL